VAKRKKTVSAPKRSKRMGLMRIRSILYQNHKSRYKNWQDTKADAKYLTQQLHEAGHRKITKKMLLTIIRGQKLAEREKRKDSKKPSEGAEYFFRNFPHLLEPIPFYSIEDEFCNQWFIISKKIIVTSKYIWTDNQGYRGGTPIPYDRTFKEYTQKMEKLQTEPRKRGEDYTTDWFFRLLVKGARWDEKLQAYIVIMITCDASGQKTFYFDEKIPKEEEELIPEVVPEEEVKPTPPKEIPPTEIPPEEKITPAQRVEIEKERVRAEAAAQAEIKKEKIKTLKELLQQGIITKEDFFEQLNKI
jgi:hypothetical protein